MFNRLVFLYLLILCSPLYSYQQSLLKSADIQVIMKQILNQHLGDKMMTTKVLQNAINTYIEQFDPQHIYLLESEVNPLLHLSLQELNQFLANYEEGNYAIFQKVNQLIQHSIFRARAIRKQVELESIDSLFNASTSKQTYDDYAKTDDDLKQRWLQNLKSFIQTYKQRYGVPGTQERKNSLIHSYEENLKEFENQYLYQDEKGQLLPKLDQENLFTLHILKALASSLDSHTSFYEANEAYDIRLHLQKEFQGIGLSLKETPNGIIVANTIEGGPAAKSGLIKPGDFLLEINGKPVAGTQFEKIMEILHDETQSEVKLGFKRPTEGNQPEKNYNVSLKREAIILNKDRVDVSDQKFGNGIIGIIKLHSFYQGADISSEKDVRNAIEQLEKKGNLKGLVLDLRDNRGGFLSQAIKVAGLFITNGIIVISKYANGEEHFYRDVDGKVSYDGPLVVLTSKITASAAEIVAQALQDYGVALIVGDEHTYGKGTIQTQTVTDNRSSSYFKVTIGLYYTPSGKTPQKNGVIADIIVPSHWQNIEVGEKYADTVDGNKISPHFDDPLNDVKAELKPWYLKYYTPKLQHRTSVWRNLVPTLQKNSQYRIANNKNYQYYIQGGKDADNDSEEDEWKLRSDKAKNGGEDDLQLEEAVNILKDMYILHASAKN